jgi:hypothetical protein
MDHSQNFGMHTGIELIDVIFAFSNVKLVKGLVMDHIRQIEAMDALGKGQTEGLKQMILAKQKTFHANLSAVERTLEGIIDANAAPQARTVGIQDIDLNTEQVQAMVNALLFAMGHMARFVPEMSASGLPGTII